MIDMGWREEGLKQQTGFLNKIEGKIADGRPLTGFEKSFYKAEVGEGHLDYSAADAGEEMVIRNRE